jgi:hypothetical protein
MVLLKFNSIIHDGWGLEPLIKVCTNAARDLAPETLNHYFILFEKMILLNIFNAPFAAAIMPKSYLDLQASPDVSVNDWLIRLVLKLESSITDESSKFTGFMGINKAGDLQYIFMPTVVSNALGDSTVLLSNSTDVSSKPSLVFVDASDLGFTSVIKTITNIPEVICPEEYLLLKFIKGSHWCV